MAHSLSSASAAPGTPGHTMTDAAPMTVMAPNFLFPCNPARVMGGDRVCFTNTYDPRNVALDAACAAQPLVCLDAITRGLLTGLQPIVSTHDSVLPAGYF